MIQALLISLIMDTVIWVIAAFILYELVKSKDGMLRKLLIGYFATVIFTYLMTCFQSLYPAYLNVIDFRIITGTPKAVAMLLLYRHIRTKNP
jgi:hypothetical protein